MKIIKTNNKEEDFSPNKILNRIKKQGEGLNVDCDILAQSVIGQIKDGITTNEIDEIIISEALGKIVLDSDYSFFAARIKMSKDFRKTNKNRFSFDIDKDIKYDYLAYSTFIKTYQQGNETPQEMYARIADYFAETTEEKQELFDMLISKQINFATPTTLNAGTGSETFISCDLSQLESDSLDGIQNSLTEIAKSSKNGAGIGVYIGNLRSSKSRVANQGFASGVVRLADMIQATLRFYNQKGRRPGSAALYLPIWHKDIIPFLELRLNEGDERLRARDIFTAVTINDFFMDALTNQKDFYLFCPYDLEKHNIRLYELSGQEATDAYNKAVELGIGEKINPLEIWQKMIASQVSTGTPYVTYIDNVNKTNMQQHFGNIKQSNLCVSGDTKILTDFGYEDIENLEGQVVNVWNGEEYSEVTVFKTGENKVLLNVVTDSGYELKCTPEHKFYVQKGYVRGVGENKLEILEKKANELEKGDKLIKFNLPVIEGIKELKYAYTQGFFSGDGCIPNDGRYLTNLVYLYGEKKNLLSLIDTRNKYNRGGKYAKPTKEKAIIHSEKSDRITCYLPEDIIANKAFVPNSDYTIGSRLTWLAGFLDADGTVTNNQGSQSIQVSSIDKCFLLDIQLMLQTLGCDSKVTFGREAGVFELPANNGTGENKLYNCKQVNRLLINGSSMYKLIKLGLKCNRLKWQVKKPNRECSQFIKIKNVEKLPDLYDTFCFTEPKRNLGMFNGILTGQCQEILNFSAPDETGQCALGSIPLPYCKDIKKAAEVLCYNINRVIDRNKYPTERALKGGLNQRSVGIGVAGLAEYLYDKGLHFEHPDAPKEMREVMRQIYEGAIKGSQRYYEDYGIQFKDYEKSDYATWNLHPCKYGIDIKDLDVDTSKPVCNTLFVALMPTASSSNLLSCTEGFELPQSMMYVRKLDKGEFVVVQDTLIKELKAIGLWDKDMADMIIQAEGSIQNIAFIPKPIRDKYKTAYEVKQRHRIDMLAEAAPFIDQSYSFNTYYLDADFTKISSALIYAWQKGLKTGVYYTRTKKKKVGTESLYKRAVFEKPKDGEDCLACSA